MIATVWWTSKAHAPEPGPGWIGPNEQVAISLKIHSTFNKNFLKYNQFWNSIIQESSFSNDRKLSQGWIGQGKLLFSYGR